ncbi:YkvI family membrane protein [Bacilliculturomica massiliensis]|uniref:YkvI family membrane protein n=1 Tax=Bacilliculturomica massiliensis TaxID=1917867 RepID=UPI0010311A9C|nr:hypothetical protein [Bacilliculturomica massiliensis]
MENSKSKDNILTYLLIGGAYISFCVGASFSTGQELMQYFSSYGAPGIAGAVIAVILMVGLIILLLKDTQKYQLANMRELFVHYGGGILGTIIYIYTVFYLFVLVVMLISGSGAIFTEYFGINNLLGRAIMTLVIFSTVILGLNRLLDILGKLSFLIIILMLIVAVAGIVRPVDGFAEGSEMAGSMENILRPGANWFISGLMYFSWAILCQTSYVASLSRNTTRTQKQQVKGLYVGGVGFMLLAVIPSIAIISNISICGNSSIPTIAIARQVGPALSMIFCVIVVIAIYTTCSPLLWSVATTFMDEKSKWFKAVVAGSVVLAFVGSNLGSFAEILYTGTSVSAYVGFVFIATILVTKFFRRPAAPQSEEDQRPETV